MKVECVEFEGPLLITPKVFKDERGFFFESHQDIRYGAYGIKTSFVQDNHSFSKYGTLRGMHFSLAGQAKLIRVVVGEVYDVIVDMRADSPNFGKWLGHILSDQNHQQLFIPEGFAHGFCVLSAEAHVLYKVSTPYHAETEKGFRYDDPDIGIKWPIDQVIVSKRDKNNPFFHELVWT